MDINELEQIVKILKQNDVTEFELSEEGVRIKLSRAQIYGQPAVVAPIAHEVRPAVIAHALPQAQLSSAASAHSNGAAEVPSNWVKVESPIVGTFYRKPRPDSDPFVKEGDAVKKGDTLCIVEAMKLMNEIEAPCSGKVEKILISDSRVVEYGELLLLINPAA